MPSTRPRPWAPASRSTRAGVHRHELLARGYELRDTTRGAGFYTMDMNNLGSIPIVGDSLPLPRHQRPGSIFTDADNVWGNGTSSNRQSAAVDAHYGQQKTYDYYKNVHGRNGIDGAGGTGYSRVHYSNKYNNAFWYDSCFCMTYGDGDGTTFSPLTALDVAGHEMTHGVTSRTAGLTLLGRVRRPERGDQRHLRHDGGVLRRQRRATRATTSSARRSTRRAPPGTRCATCTSPRLDGKSAGLLVQQRRARWTCTTPAAWPTTSSTCWPRAPTPRRPGQPHLQRLDGHRHRPGRGGEDLVPRAHGLHDVVHQLRGCAHGHAQCRGRTSTARAAPSTTRWPPPGPR